MLSHSFVLTTAAASIVAAVAKAITAGYRTGDVYQANEPANRKVGSREMGDAIAAAL
jgi:3-isopropylmalate dehydrogenase